MGILDFLGKNKITMSLFKSAFKKMTDEQKEDFILKALEKMARLDLTESKRASGKENFPANPQMEMMVKHWKGMSDWQKKQLVKQILPQMSEAIERGDFDKMMGQNMPK